MKFSPETRGALIERISAGVSHKDACRATGISHPTLKLWLKKGHDGVPVYAEFAEALESAKAQAKARPKPMDEEELLSVVSEAARRGSTAAMKLRWEIILAYRKPAETEKPQADPLQVVDDLAARRAA